jgi:hypothetical protein
MSDKLIKLEEHLGPLQASYERLLKMVPERDKDDTDLRRFIAFRLEVDGEASVSEYLVRKIREMIRCAYRGRFFEFIKDDVLERECREDQEQDSGGPNDVA